MKGRLIISSKDGDLLTNSGVHERLDDQDKALAAIMEEIKDLKVKRNSDQTFKEKVKAWFK